MAASRLEKVGTIYSRVTGLLRSGALKEEDKPIWYNIYKAFPPKYEPRFDRPAPNIPIRNIFYAEDEIRAKFHKHHNKSVGVINMNDRHTQTATQKFIGVYNKLKKEGEVSEEKLFDAALDVWKNEGSLFSEKPLFSAETKEDGQTSLASTFREAQKKGKADSSMNINVKDLFKE